MHAYDRHDAPLCFDRRKTFSFIPNCLAKLAVIPVHMSSRKTLKCKELPTKCSYPDHIIRSEKIKNQNFSCRKV